MTRAASEKITAARQFCPGEDGCIVLLDVTDVETGSVAQRLVTLSLKGTATSSVLSFAKALPAATGSYGAFELALAVLPALRPVAALLSSALPKSLIEIAVAGTNIFVLDGERSLFDGTRQYLHRFETGPDGWIRVAPSPDLAPLRLSPSRCVTGLMIAENALLAMVSDPLAGFDVFRLSLDETSAVFVPVVTAGMGRFMLNAAACAVGLCPGGILLGTAALAKASVMIGNWGPELLVLFDDGTTDLVFGQPRLGRDALMLPASGHLPGFGNPANAAVKAIATGQRAGELITCIAIQDHEGGRVADRAAALPDSLDYRGPVRLYQSADLVDWKPVSAHLPGGIGAVTALALTSAGLLVGHEALGADTLPVTFVPLT
jgi:hypothetical protein